MSNKKFAYIWNACETQVTPFLSETGIPDTGFAFPVSYRN